MLDSTTNITNLDAAVAAARLKLDAESENMENAKQVHQASKQKLDSATRLHHSALTEWGDASARLKRARNK